MAGIVHAGNRQMRKIGEPVRQQRLLDSARNRQLLLQPLPLAFPLNQPRVVHNAGRLHGQRIQNLAVERGECRDAARVKIDHAQQLAVLLL